MSGSIYTENTVSPMLVKTNKIIFPGRLLCPTSRGKSPRRSDTLYNLQQAREAHQWCCVGAAFESRLGVHRAKELCMKRNRVRSGPSAIHSQPILLIFGPQNRTNRWSAIFDFQESRSGALGNGDENRDERAGPQ